YVVVKKEEKRTIKDEEGNYVEITVVSISLIKSKDNKDNKVVAELIMPLSMSKRGFKHEVRDFSKPRGIRLRRTATPTHGDLAATRRTIKQAMESAKPRYARSIVSDRTTITRPQSPRREIDVRKMISPSYLRPTPSTQDAAVISDDLLSDIEKFNKRWSERKQRTASDEQGEPKFFPEVSIKDVSFPAMSEGLFSFIRKKKESPEVKGEQKIRIRKLKNITDPIRALAKKNGNVVEGGGIFTGDQNDQLTHLLINDIIAFPEGKDVVKRLGVIPTVFETFLAEDSNNNEGILFSSPVEGRRPIFALKEEIVWTKDLEKLYQQYKTNDGSIIYAGYFGEDEGQDFEIKIISPSLKRSIGTERSYIREKVWELRGLKENRFQGGTEHGTVHIHLDLPEEVWGDKKGNLYFYTLLRSFDFDKGKILTLISDTDAHYIIYSKGLNKENARFLYGTEKGYSSQEVFSMIVALGFDGEFIAARGLDLYKVEEDGMLKEFQRMAGEARSQGKEYDDLIQKREPVGRYNINKMLDFAYIVNDYTVKDLPSYVGDHAMLGSQDLKRKNYLEDGYFNRAVGSSPPEERVVGSSPPEKKESGKEKLSKEKEWFKGDKKSGEDFTQNTDHSAKSVVPSFLSAGKTVPTSHRSSPTATMSTAFYAFANFSPLFAGSGVNEDERRGGGAQGLSEEQGLEVVRDAIIASESSEALATVGGLMGEVFVREGTRLEENAEGEMVKITSTEVCLRTEKGDVPVVEFSLDLDQKKGFENEIRILRRMRPWQEVTGKELALHVINKTIEAGVFDIVPTDVETIGWQPFAGRLTLNSEQMLISSGEIQGVTQGERHFRIPVVWQDKDTAGRKAQERSFTTTKDFEAGTIRVKAGAFFSPGSQIFYADDEGNKAQNPQARIVEGTIVPVSRDGKYIAPLRVSSKYTERIKFTEEGWIERQRDKGEAPKITRKIYATGSLNDLQRLGLIDTADISVAEKSIFQQERKVLKAEIPEARFQKVLKREKTINRVVSDFEKYFVKTTNPRKAEKGSVWYRAVKRAGETMELAAKRANVKDEKERFKDMAKRLREAAENASIFVFNSQNLNEKDMRFRDFLSAMKMPTPQIKERVAERLQGSRIVGAAVQNNAGSTEFYLTSLKNKARPYLENRGRIVEGLSFDDARNASPEELLSFAAIEAMIRQRDPKISAAQARQTLRSINQAASKDMAMRTGDGGNVKGLKSASVPEIKRREKPSSLSRTSRFPSPSEIRNKYVPKDTIQERIDSLVREENVRESLLGSMIGLKRKKIIEEERRKTVITPEGKEITITTKATAWRSKSGIGTGKKEELLQKPSIFEEKRMEGEIRNLKGRMQLKLQQQRATAGEAARPSPSDKVSHYIRRKKHYQRPSFRQVNKPNIPGSVFVVSATTEGSPLNETWRKYYEKKMNPQTPGHEGFYKEFLARFVLALTEKEENENWVKFVEDVKAGEFPAWESLLVEAEEIVKSGKAARFASGPLLSKKEGVKRAYEHEGLKKRGMGVSIADKLAQQEALDAKIKYVKMAIRAVDRFVLSVPDDIESAAIKLAVNEGIKRRTVYAGRMEGGKLRFYEVINVPEIKPEKKGGEKDAKEEEKEVATAEDIQPVQPVKLADKPAALNEIGKAIILVLQESFDPSVDKEIKAFSERPKTIIDTSAMPAIEDEEKEAIPAAPEVGSTGLRSPPLQKAPRMLRTPPVKPLPSVTPPLPVSTMPLELTAADKEKGKLESDTGETGPPPLSKESKQYAVGSKKGNNQDVTSSQAFHAEQPFTPQIPTIPTEVSSDYAILTSDSSLPPEVVQAFEEGFKEAKAFKTKAFKSLSPEELAEVYVEVKEGYKHVYNKFKVRLEKERFKIKTKQFVHSVLSAANIVVGEERLSQAILEKLGAGKMFAERAAELAAIRIFSKPKKDVSGTLEVWLPRGQLI
ncbi:MAG: hypothetical protein U9Q21_00280, partial [Candidatus Auribacterota bacterium]|nr:hypothetical protein [Candidatus Auribacterota bacterium]